MNSGVSLFFLPCSVANILEEERKTAPQSGMAAKNAELCVPGVLGILWCVDNISCFPKSSKDNILSPLTVGEAHVLEVLHASKPRPLTGLIPRSHDKSAKRRSKKAYS